MVTNSLSEALKSPWATTATYSTSCRMSASGTLMTSPGDPAVPAAEYWNVSATGVAVTAHAAVTATVTCGTAPHRAYTPSTAVPSPGVATATLAPVLLAASCTRYSNTSPTKFTLYAHLYGQLSTSHSDLSASGSALAVSPLNTSTEQMCCVASSPDCDSGARCGTPATPGNSTSGQQAQ